MRKLTKLSLVVLLAALPLLGQSVKVVGKKQIYSRRKPISTYKRSFSIRRPIVTAATPALSRAITAAVRPETVLDIQLKDGLGEFQWLEEADFKLHFNRDGILTLEEWMVGTAAYPDSVTKYVVVDVRSGKRLRPADIFIDLPGLARLVKRMQAKEVKQASEELRKNPDLDGDPPQDLFTDSDFTVKDLNEFSIDGAGVTFHYDYGFPHVIEALQPEGEYFLSWAELKPFTRPDGLLARFIR
jgi:hypothetical protein